MRRNDTSSIGYQAEQLAATLLRERGFEVTNLNDVRVNNPLTICVQTRTATRSRFP